jgi:hypothetical protein
MERERLVRLVRLVPRGPSRHRRDDLTKGRAEVSFAVVQSFFFADDVHGNLQPPRGRIEMSPSGPT